MKNKKDRLNILVVCVLISLGCVGCAQSKKLQGKRIAKFDLGLIVGNWRSEEDSAYILRFDKTNVAMISEPDTAKPVFYPYHFSGSCKLKDTLSDLNINNTYVIILADDIESHFCYEILNLTERTLSWFNYTGSRVELFYRITNDKK